MRLGVSGIIVPHRIDEVLAAHVAAVREHGFAGFATRFWDHPATVTPERAHRVRSLFDDNGVVMSQATGYWQTLIHPQPAGRVEAIQNLQNAIRVAAELGAGAVLTGPGTLNPRAASLPDDQRRWGAWWPHRDNHGPAVVDRLIDSLRQAAPVAEDCGVMLSLECHVISTIDTPEVARSIVESVGSPALTINIDPVNYIDTVPRYFDTTKRLHEIFDVLASFIVSGDAKDIVLDDPVVVHLKEVPAGDGELDYATFLRRFQTACPDGFLHLEHFPLAEALRGQHFIRQQCAALAIPILE